MVYLGLVWNQLIMDLDLLLVLIGSAHHLILLMAIIWLLLVHPAFNWKTTPIEQLDSTIFHIISSAVSIFFFFLCGSGSNDNANSTFWGPPSRTQAATQSPKHTLLQIFASVMTYRIWHPNYFFRWRWQAWCLHFPLDFRLFSLTVENASTSRNGSISLAFPLPLPFLCTIIPFLVYAYTLPTVIWVCVDDTLAHPVLNTITNIARAAKHYAQAVLYSSWCTNTAVAMTKNCTDVTISKSERT